MREKDSEKKTVGKFDSGATRSPEKSEELPEKVTPKVMETLRNSRRVSESEELSRAKSSEGNGQPQVHTEINSRHPPQSPRTQSAQVRTYDLKKSRIKSDGDSIEQRQVSESTSSATTSSSDRAAKQNSVSSPKSTSTSNIRASVDRKSSVCKPVFFPKKLNKF